MAVPMLAVKFREGLQMTVHIWPTSAAMSEPKQVSPIENSQRSCVGSFDLSSKRQLSSRKVDNRSWLTHIFRSFGVSQIRGLRPRPTQSGRPDQ
jgi:hypothetical protein